MVFKFAEPEPDLGLQRAIKYDFVEFPAERKDLHKALFQLMDQVHATGRHFQAKILSNVELRLSFYSKTDEGALKAFDLGDPIDPLPHSSTEGANLLGILRTETKIDFHTPLYFTLEEGNPMPKSLGSLQECLGKFFCGAAPPTGNLIQHATSLRRCYSDPNKVIQTPPALPPPGNSSVTPPAQSERCLHPLIHAVATICGAKARAADGETWIPELTEEELALLLGAWRTANGTPIGNLSDANYAYISQVKQDNGGLILTPARKSCRGAILTDGGRAKRLLRLPITIALPPLVRMAPLQLFLAGVRMRPPLSCFTWVIYA